MRRSVGSHRRLEGQQWRSWHSQGAWFLHLLLPMCFFVEDSIPFQLQELKKSNGNACCGCRLLTGFLVSTMRHDPATDGSNMALTSDINYARHQNKCNLYFLMPSLAGDQSATSLDCNGVQHESFHRLLLHNQFDLEEN